MFSDLTLLPALLALLPWLLACLPALGAVTSATVLDNTILNGLMKIVDITATADADTEITVTHSLGTKTPIKIDFERRLAVARASEWLADSVTSTNVHFSKLSVASSSSTGVQARAYIWVPHTIIR